MKNFNNKVAAITGAGSGIGRALAIQLAEEGCHLALSDVNEAGLAETLSMVSRKPVSGEPVKVTTAIVDVADKKSVFDWAEQVLAEHGKVNLLFNNAGVALAGTVIDTEIDDYEWIININLWGVIYGSKAFLPHLVASGDGHIVNVSSIFGLFSQPTQSGYNASKFAVRGFTESLRQELDLADNGVSASCVHPGGIQTNIARSARLNKSLTGVTGMDEISSRETFEKLFRTTADEAAQIILQGVRRDARRILVGPDAHVIDKFQRSMPSAYQRVIGQAMRIRKALA